MQEFDFTIEDPLRNGIRPESYTARNQPFLIECKNLRPTGQGLTENPTITDPDSVFPTTNWPFPQYFRGKSVSLIADDQALYKVTEGGTWSKSALRIYSAASAASPQTEVVDAGDFSSGTPWTTGTGWAVGSGVATATASTDTLTQANGDQSNAMGQNKLYRVTYTVVVTSGTVRVGIGSVYGTTRSASGTYTEDIFATDATPDLVFDGVSAFTGTIDDVSVKEIEQTTIPSGGGAWHFADFRKVWFLFNESCTLACTPYYSTYRDSGDFIVVRLDDVMNDNLSFSGSLNINTGTNWGQRLVLGGIDSSTLLAQDYWTELFDIWQEYQGRESVTFEDITMGTNVLMISTNSGGDVYWPFVFEMSILGFPARASSDAVASAKANYLDYIKRGEIAFVPLMVQGEIRNIMRLGNGIAVYADDGVVFVQQGEDGMFVQEEIADVGIASRSAVAGDMRMHMFLDTNKALWRVTPDLNVERIGHKEQFASLVASETTNPILASYDTDQKEFYFCSDQEGFCYTRTGLGEVTILPTSLVVVGDELVGPVESLSDTAVLVETDVFDMNLRSIKTLQAVQVGFQDITNLQVQVLFRDQTTGSFREATAQPVNEGGTCTPIISAYDFKLKITGTLGSDSKIDYIIVRWKNSDKRAIRGTVNG